jgi:hypothetical protein
VPARVSTSRTRSTTNSSSSSLSRSKRSRSASASPVLLSPSFALLLSVAQPVQGGHLPGPAGLPGPVRPHQRVHQGRQGLRRQARNRRWPRRQRGLLHRVRRSSSRATSPLTTAQAHDLQRCRGTSSSRGSSEYKLTSLCSTRARSSRRRSSAPSLSSPSAAPREPVLGRADREQVQWRGGAHQGRQ